MTIAGFVGVLVFLLGMALMLGIVVTDAWFPQQNLKSVIEYFGLIFIVPLFFAAISTAVVAALVAGVHYVLDRG